jgi:hypothetical protein
MPGDVLSTGSTWQSFYEFSLYLRGTERLQQIKSFLQSSESVEEATKEFERLMNWGAIRVHVM